MAILNGFRKNEYSRVGEHEDPEAGWAGLAAISTRVLRLSARSAVVVVLMLVAIPLVLFGTGMSGVQRVVSVGLGASVHDLSSEMAFNPADSVDEIPAGTRRLHIIAPADEPSPNICKLALSGMAMGYPPPVVINWGKDFGKTRGFGKSHVGKIYGALEYLDAMTSQEPGAVHKADRIEDDDLVIMLDAYDVWFQLPPDVLVERYYRHVREANARLRESWVRAPGNRVEGMPMRQTIVISSQKRCFPNVDAGVNLHCEDLPESTLPEDLYLDKTDEDPSSSSEDYHNVRPRFMNSGTIMGPAGDLKRMFRRADEKVYRKLHEGANPYSDQGILGEILAEQTLWRRWRQERYGTPGGNLPEDEAGEMIRDQFEYHVGLDYEQDLFIATVMSDDDGEWVRLGNQTEIELATQEHAPALGKPRVTGLPADLEGRELPIGNGDVTWGDVPLYTDMWTTSVPAIIHNNAHKNGVKTQRAFQWWDRTWYFPHLRELLTQRLDTKALRPIARVPATTRTRTTTRTTTKTTKTPAGDATSQEQGQELRSDEAQQQQQQEEEEEDEGDGGRRELLYLPPRAYRFKKMMRVFRPGETRRGMKSLSWDEACKARGQAAWWEEIFRDGGGRFPPGRGDGE